MKRLAIAMVVMKLVIPNIINAMPPVAGGEQRLLSTSEMLLNAAFSQREGAYALVIDLIESGQRVTVGDLQKIAAIEQRYGMTQNGMTQTTRLLEIITRQKVQHEKHKEQDKLEYSEDAVSKVCPNIVTETIGGCKIQ
jgi:hypothetical protein